MITRFGLLQRAAGLSDEEFSTRWEKGHGPIAAQFPGLRSYRQHVVVDKQQFGIDHARGGADLDGFSELQFDSLDAMHRAVAAPAFASALQDEDNFLGDVKIVACERNVVVTPNLGDGPVIKRMTLLKRLPGVSVEEFRHQWCTIHANWVSQWPDVLGYVQNVVVERYYRDRTSQASYDEVPVDGIVEFWFRDKETAARTYATDVVTKTQQHALEFLDEITPFFVQSRQIMGS